MGIVSKHQKIYSITTVTIITFKICMSQLIQLHFRKMQKLKYFNHSFKRLSKDVSHFVSNSIQKISMMIVLRGPRFVTSIVKGM